MSHYHWHSKFACVLLYMFYSSYYFPWHSELLHKQTTNTNTNTNTKQNFYLKFQICFLCDELIHSIFDDDMYVLTILPENVFNTHHLESTLSSEQHMKQFPIPLNEYNHIWSLCCNFNCYCYCTTMILENYVWGVVEWCWKRREYSQCIRCQKLCNCKCKQIVLHMDSRLSINLWAIFFFFLLCSFFLSIDTDWIVQYI